MYLSLQGKRVADQEPEDSSRLAAIRRPRTRGSKSRDEKRLNSDQVYEYLENYWDTLSEPKKQSFAVLDPLWYTMYKEGMNKEKVITWMTKKETFSKPYVILPIVQWGHWNVVIFCNFSRTLDEKKKSPCILLLDSLEKAEHARQLEPDMRKLVGDVGRKLGYEDEMERSKEMPFLVPKIPQQRNGEECGHLVLYFVKLFVENIPENFSLEDGYPYFMKRDWFGFEEFEGFCKTLAW